LREQITSKHHIIPMSPYNSYVLGKVEFYMTQIKSLQMSRNHRQLLLYSSIMDEKLTEND